MIASTSRPRRPPPRVASGAEGWRAILWQAASFALLAALLVLAFHATSRGLQARGIESGFAFLETPARIPIANAPIAFNVGEDSYARALLIGTLNTAKVALVAIVLATVLGLAIGIGQLASNVLVSKACALYVEVVRNVPVLLHIFLWYQVLINLKSPAEVGEGAHWLAITNRGIRMASPLWDVAWYCCVGMTLGALIGIGLISGRAERYRVARGAEWPPRRLCELMLVAIALATWLGFGPVLSFERPTLDGFDFSGGASISPEYCALTIGLVAYTATFIGEIVRAGILSVPKGQWEAAAMLGLTRPMALRKVVLPQALRTAIPPLTSEYLGILKNSSLAIAIGYQDLVAIGNTVLNETGQAVSVIFLIMAFYVAVSLAVSAAMSAFNRRVMLVER